MSDTNLPILRPLPQRAFQLTPSSTEPPTPPTPDNEKDPSYLDCKPSAKAGLSSRNRSIQNLTTSTLFGIYAPAEPDVSREDPLGTPWGPGAMTPQTSRSFKSPTEADDKKPPVIGAFERPQLRKDPVRHPAHQSFVEIFFATLFRSILLFGAGMAYGMVVTHLHDDQGLAPVKVGGIRRDSWRYLLFWGLAGVGLGTLLPVVDILLADSIDARQVKEMEGRNGKPSEAEGMAGVEHEIPRSSSESGLGAEWNPVVRSIGAFIGIAFAIVCAILRFWIMDSLLIRLQRRLPWQSTLQVSLTLALVNPVLWYLIDRSKPGFILAATIGIFGTFVLLGINPEMVPSPATPSPSANGSNGSVESMEPSHLMSHEIIGVWTWVASVLFCSCVCFGNIGRKLAVGVPERRKSFTGSQYGAGFM